MTDSVKRRSSIATDALSGQLLAVSFYPERDTIHVMHLKVFS